MIKRLRLAALGVCLAVAALPCAPVLAAPPVPVGPLAFSDHFASLDVDDLTGTPGSHRWAPYFGSRGNLSVGNASLPGNGEAQVYLYPQFAGVVCGLDAAGRPQNVYGRPGPAASAAGAPCYTRPGPAPLGYNPFSLLPGGGVRISADRLSPTPLLWNHRYWSGLLSTRYSFSQRYGYVEVRARLPRGKGAFPAVWMVPVNGQWPPELDGLEAGGGDVRTVFQSVHTSAETPRSTTRVVRLGFDASAGWHTYGFAWSDQEVVWYADGVKTARRRAPADFNQPFYLMINLAVGASWAAIGQPDATTRFPLNFDIASVEVWRLGPGPIAGPIPAQAPATAAKAGG